MSTESNIQPLPKTLEEFKKLDSEFLRLAAELHSDDAGRVAFAKEQLQSLAETYGHKDVEGFLDAIREHQKNFPDAFQDIGQTIRDAVNNAVRGEAKAGAKNALIIGSVIAAVAVAGAFLLGNNKNNESKTTSFAEREQERAQSSASVSR